MSPERVSFSEAPTAHRSLREFLDAQERSTVLILGLVLLLLGFFLHIPVLWTIGIILLVIGAVLMVLGTAGRAVGGRTHWY